MKKILVCGSRTFTDNNMINNVLLNHHWYGDGFELIHGDARGADRLAKQICILNGIKQTPFPPDWIRYGGRAGLIRNLDMLNQKPDLVIAFFDKTRSRGTMHTVINAKNRDIPVEEYGLE